MGDGNLGLNKKKKCCFVAQVTTIIEHSFSLGNLINYWVNMLSIDSMLITF